MPGSRIFSWRNLLKTVAAIGAMGMAAPGRADPIPPGWAASHMEPVGYSAMDNRLGAFKMAIRKVNDRWYLYTGHLWHYGWSIVDVTDPKDPKFVKFIPGPENTWTIQMTLHDNIMVTALQKSSPAWGADANRPSAEGILIWDIGDPVNPKQVSEWKTGGTGTHRNSYPGGKYAYLSAGTPGYDGNILIILDVSDPAHPKEAGRWSMPGQKEGEPKGTGPQGFHGPATVSPDGKMISMGYAPALVNPRHHRCRQPEADRQAPVQPAVPGGRRPSRCIRCCRCGTATLLFVSSEASAERCAEALNFAAHGRQQESGPAPPCCRCFRCPAPPPGAPYKNFCEKGGPLRSA